MSTDKSKLTQVETCPRCGWELRRNPKDLGALSRVDDTTVICSDCGEAEAAVGPRRDGVHSRDGWHSTTVGTLS